MREPRVIQILKEEIQTSWVRITPESPDHGPEVTLAEVWRWRSLRFLPSDRHVLSRWRGGRYRVSLARLWLSTR